MFVVIPLGGSLLFYTLEDVGWVSNHRFYSEIDRLCFPSKNLYNYANYLIRQAFIFQNTYLSYHTIQKTVQGTEPYQALPAQVSQQILMILTRFA